MHPFKITLLFLFGLSFFPDTSLAAKSAAPALTPLPGEVKGTRIYFEGGRVLDWPAQGALLLRAADGSVLATVDLQAKVRRESGTEALGLEVEEADLGGSANAQKYLGGKKAPKGRALQGDALAGKPLAAEATQSREDSSQGIPIRTLTYPNGAYLLQFQWPDSKEELYFDRRKTLIYDQVTKKLGTWTATLKQFGDGSFSRSYQDARGEVSYTYDANDRSYRFSFQNSQREPVLELGCAETCRPE